MQNKAFFLFLRSIVIFSFFILLFGGVKSADAQTDGLLPPPVNQLIVKYRTEAKLAEAAQAQAEFQMQRLSETAGVELRYLRPMSGNAHVIRLPERLPVEQALKITQRLTALPEVEYAEPDYIFTVDEEAMSPQLLTTNDTYYNSQWHYFAPAAGHYGVNAPAAWDITTGKAGIYIAVLDTGILDHPDLSGRWVGGYDMISDVFAANDLNGRDNDPHDPGDWVDANDCYSGSAASASSWHGTHVSGTIGAASNNNQGVAGLNWVSKIVPVRVLGRCGGTLSDISDGIRWAAGLSVPGVPANANPAKVINMSLGGDGSCPIAYQTAINDAYSAGSLIVVAAGNSNADAANFRPANCANVVTVAATDRDGNRSYYSNYGSLVELSAPGGAQSYINDPNGVLSTANSGTTVPGTYTYLYEQGTSMAAPHVSGVASLVFSRNPALTPTQVLSIMQNTVTAFPAGSTCNTSSCGSGIVNAGAALASMQVDLEYVYLPLILRNFASLPPSDFNKTTPANGATGQSIYPTLSWGTSSLAGSYEYCIDTSNNNACDTIWTSTATNTSTGINNLTPATNYYWQVRSINTYSTTYADNAVWWSFTTTTSPVYEIDNGDFENGSTGWTEYSTHGWDIIVDPSEVGITPHSGTYAAWLGGEFDDISYIEQQITIPGGTPYLVYWHWIASEDECGYDIGRVMVNNVEVDSYDLCNSTSTSGWVTHSVNLSAYIGQNVMLQIRAETDFILNSNLFVDDVSLQASAPLSPQLNNAVPVLDPAITSGKAGIISRGELPLRINGTTPGEPHLKGIQFHQCCPDLSELNRIKCVSPRQPKNARIKSRLAIKSKMATPTSNSPPMVLTSLARIANWRVIQRCEAPEISDKSNNGRPNPMPNQKNTLNLLITSAAVKE